MSSNHSSGHHDAHPPGITRVIARYAATPAADQVPAEVRRHASRTLLNWVGCAVGGSQEPAPVRALKALQPFCGQGQASLFGHTERVDALHAALINGVSSHVLDFDDTHLATVVHPAGPVAAALCAFAEYQLVSGEDFMNALVIGCEVECRLALAVTPEHYAMGWHITGTCGVFGAAAAVGRLLQLDEQHMVWALGIAASQSAGLKVQFGSDTKSLHPGCAARNGMMAALMAQASYTAAEDAIEGFDGWAQALSTRHDWSKITDGLGSRYELLNNTFKPFACGIVSHPAIDAAIRLRSAHKLQPSQLHSITAKVHPLVLNLMGKQTPTRGLEGKFSIYHCIAVALVTGQAGKQAFTDAAVLDPATVAVRQLVTATPDKAIQSHQVDMTIELTDGRSLHQFIEHAVGSQHNPMTDQQLEDKFAGQTVNILSKEQCRQLMDLCWNAWTLNDAGDIGRAGTVQRNGGKSE